MAGSSTDALLDIQHAQATAQNPNDILAGQRQQLGVNAARDTVTGLRGAIDNTTKLLKQVAPGVMGRTANSLVTNAQANRIIQNESAPIQSSLTEQGEKYGRANEDANRLESQASEAASNIYKGQQDKLSYAQNMYNILYGREKDAEAAAQAERDRQESVRQFNVSASRSGGGRSGGGSSSADAVAKIDAYLKPQLGRDGYASPYDYNDALSAWVQDGYSASQFASIFGKYKNPKTKGYR